MVENARYSPGRAGGGTLWADDVPRDRFVAGVAGYVEAYDRPSLVQFYDDFMEDFVAERGAGIETVRGPAEPGEHRFAPGELRDALDTGLDEYGGVNVRVQGDGYGQAVFGYEEGSVTVRVEDPQRMGRGGDPDTREVVEEFFPGLADTVARW